MGRFVSGFLLGAFFAFASAPYLFPYGVQAGVQHWVQDLRDELPIVTAYFALP